MEPADPKTGLTRKEKDAVRDSWTQLASDWKAKGPDFFIRLFKAYPSILAFFTSLNGMDFDEMKQSSKLRAHTINFKMGIKSYVENLDDPECLVILIQKNTANHFRRGIRTAEFKDAFTLFLNYLQEVQNIDDFTKGAWEKTCAVIASIIDDHVKELEEEKISLETEGK